MHNTWFPVTVTCFPLNPPFPNSCPNPVTACPCGITAGPSCSRRHGQRWIERCRANRSRASSGMSLGRPTHHRTRHPSPTAAATLIAHRPRHAIRPSSAANPCIDVGGSHKLDRETNPSASPIPIPSTSHPTSLIPIPPLKLQDDCAILRVWFQSAANLSNALSRDLDGLADPYVVLYVTATKTTLPPRRRLHNTTSVSQH